MKFWQLPSSFDLCRWQWIISALFTINIVVWPSLQRIIWIMPTLLAWSKWIGELQNHHFALWYKLVRILTVYNREDSEQSNYLGFGELFFSSFLIIEHFLKGKPKCKINKIRASWVECEMETLEPHLIPLTLCIFSWDKTVHWNMVHGKNMDCQVRPRFKSWLLKNSYNSDDY